MIDSIGIFLIIFVGIVKLNGRCIPKLQSNPKVKKFLEIGNIDKAFRVMQYACSLVIGDKLLPSTVQNGFPDFLLASSKQQHLLQIDYLRRIVRQVRKVIKILLRGPEFIRVIVRKKIPVPSQITKNIDSKLYKLQYQLFLQVIFKTVAQICLVIFYFTDHHEFFYEWGILSTKEQISQQIGDIGLLFRITYSILNIISLIFGMLRIHSQLKLKISKEPKKVGKNFKLNIIDMVAHMGDIFLFYGLYTSGFLTKTNIGLLGIAGSGLKLARVFY